MACSLFFHQISNFDPLYLSFESRQTFFSKFESSLFPQIGAGAFATVFLGTSRKSGTEYAVKDIDRSKMTWNGRDALQDEIGILQQLQAAPAIVHLEDVFPEARSCYLVMELMSGGQLFDRIIEKALFTEKEAKGSCRAILSALDFMHDRRMVHRDLKPENLLLKVRIVL